VADIIWRPSLRPFLKRSALAGVLFSLLINSPYFVAISTGLELWGLAFLLISLPLSALYYAFIFDDFSAWNRVRHDEWKLTANGLAYRNVDDSEAFSSIQLHDIQKVKRSFWRGVNVRVSDGKALTMSYLSDPKTVQQTILNRMPEGASS
jgi:hypothetical protein